MNKRNCKRKRSRIRRGNKPRVKPRRNETIELQELLHFEMMVIRLGLEPRKQRERLVGMRRRLEKELRRDKKLPKKPLKFKELLLQLM